LNEGTRLPYLPGVTPEFTRHFEFHYTEGGLPFSGSKEPVLGGFFRHQSQASGLEAVVALVDAWPAPLLPLATGPLPASSIRWSAHFMGAPPTSFDGYWWYRSHVIRAESGYASIVGRLYAGDTLIAWSEQLVAAYG
jgi:acyl-CoA thioesterase